MPSKPFTSAGSLMVVLWSQYGSMASSEPLASAPMRSGILSCALTDGERSPTSARRGGGEAATACMSLS